MTDTNASAAMTNEGASQSTAATEPANTTTETAQPASVTDTKDGEATTTTPVEPDAKAEDKPAGAPEKYEFKLPDGFQKTELLSELEVVAKDANLPQEQAQKFVDLGMKMQQEFISKQQEAVKKLNEDWIASTKSDKEIGGDKLEQNMAVAKKGLEAVATPELKDLLVQTGLGNHPEIIKAFFKVGQKIRDDQHVTANSPGVKESAAKVLYPS